ncbi:MAG: phosphotransferase family protein [Porticoccaceae bacterium]
MSKYQLKQHPTEAWKAQLRERFPTHSHVDETLTRKLDRRAGPTHRSQSVDEVIEKLTAFLSKRIDAPFAIADVRSLAGGSSKEQYAFDIIPRDGGQPETRHYVLRMRPAESIVETHVLREYQALKAARHALPVPEVFWHDAQGDELGQPAIISEFRPGVTAPPYKGAYSPKRGFDEKYRALLAPQFTRHFANLAKLDWRASDMSAFDKPKPGTNEAAISSINWWQRVWEEDSFEPHPLMQIAARWLRDNAPVSDHISIVHTDFRKGNFLFDLESGEITAILDWELAHLGDRHEDLAFFLSPLFASHDENGVYLVGGLMPRDVFLDEYQNISGLPVDEQRIDYYRIFNAWRTAINTLATGARCMFGQKTHQDIRVGWVTYTYVASLKTLLDEMKKRY